MAARLLAARLLAAGLLASRLLAALQARLAARLFFQRFPFEPAHPKILIKLV